MLRKKKVSSIAAAMMLSIGVAHAAGWHTFYNPDGTQWSKEQYETYKANAIGATTSTGTQITDVHIDNKGLWIDTELTNEKEPRHTTVTVGATTVTTWEGLMPTWSTVPEKGEQIGVANAVTGEYFTFMQENIGDDDEVGRKWRAYISGLRGTTVYKAENHRTYELYSLAGFLNRYDTGHTAFLSGKYRSESLANVAAVMPDANLFVGTYLTTTTNEDYDLLRLQVQTRGIPNEGVDYPPVKNIFNF